MSRSFPADLAKHVRTQLVARKQHPPSQTALTTLFETLYFASLKQEENQPISCRIAFVNRKRPDPDPPERIVADRWQCCPLAHDLPLDVRNLVKLSTAVDPWGSTLAVETDSGGDWRIWGLIDQSVHYSTYVVKEAADGVEMPGMFQAVIQGTGEIAVYQTYILLGSLRQDVLTTKQHRVFQSGPVHSKLMKSIKTFQKQARGEVGSALYDERDHWDGSIERLWVSALCRILIGIQKYHHGGAVLISDAGSWLNAKYSLSYRRLADALFRAAVLEVRNTANSDEIHEKYLEEEAEDIPTHLYFNESVTRNELADTHNEITGCIRFLASLARVDGLIWLDSRLNLKGFGVEITVQEDPAHAFLALNSQATKTSKLDLNHFGTRHRSMLRYCAADSNGVGFIVSQDGDVRAATQNENKVLLWDNIRIQSLVNARSLPAA
jgi:hypothetical protein